jgi:hypothetical protein
MGGEVGVALAAPPEAVADEGGEPAAAGVCAGSGNASTESNANQPRIVRGVRLAARPAVVIRFSSVVQKYLNLRQCRPLFEWLRLSFRRDWSPGR